ncbi:hypothetical protein WCN91_12620 [Pseudoalteromonas sp. YIC-827]|uniref:Uncharacterized protein n=1 Tax=Pseudoalteromonas qingdaonensis TaxID=3131913 RepID=A0ABU9N0Z5_9GAMM
MRLKIQQKIVIDRKKKQLIAVKSTKAAFLLVILPGGKSHELGRGNYLAIY